MTDRSKRATWDLTALPWWLYALSAAVFVIRGGYLLLAPSSTVGDRLLGVALLVVVSPACALSAIRNWRSQDS